MFVIYALFVFICIQYLIMHYLESDVSFTAIQFEAKRSCGDINPTGHGQTLTHSLAHIVAGVETVDDFAYINQKRRSFCHRRLKINTYVYTTYIMGSNSNSI